MSIFDEAQYKMQMKRLDRLKEGKKKAALDAQKNPYATYQGRDPVDGTEMVQIGTSESVSGFKLISNAPMAIGDRVALRKNNQGGLQRVDDRNRLISTDLEEESIKEKFTVECGWFNGLDSTVDSTQFAIESTNLYQYDSLGDKVTLINNLSFEAFWDGNTVLYPATSIDVATIGNNLTAEAIFPVFPFGDGLAVCQMIFRIGKRGILKSKILKKMNGDTNIYFSNSQCPLQFNAAINSYNIIGTPEGVFNLASVSEDATDFFLIGLKSDATTVESLTVTTSCDWRFVF
jgi:hypothetical protein